LCWKKVPEKSVFDLVFLSEEDKFKLFHAGKKTISDLSADDFQDDKIKGEILCRQQNKAFFDAEKFKEATIGLEKPVSFVGFLGNRIAIPKWKNYKPYDMVPVSISVVGTKGEAHKSYFNSSPESCPDEEFIAFLKANLEHAGGAVVFEKDRFVLQIEQLIRRNPDHEEFLNTCLEKTFDLKDLIMDFTYFNPEFSGEIDYLDLHKILPPEDNLIPEYSSDALAINVYLKQPASEMTSSEMIDLTFWRASLTKSFFDYLNNK
jgi:hypothetical protein